MPVSLSFPLFDYSGSWLQGKSFAVKELRIHPTARGCCRELRLVPWFFVGWLAWGHSVILLNKFGGINYRGGDRSFFFSPVFVATPDHRRNGGFYI